MHLRVPQRGQHSPSGTVAVEQGTSGQEIFLQTIAESYEGKTVSPVNHVAEDQLSACAL